MKPSPLAALILGTLATSAIAGPGFGVYVNGGCGPRYVAPPVCYAPRVYYAPRVVYYQPACYAPASVVRVPVPVYRAPIVTTSVTVGGSPFCWR